jgi:hypothetical protein
MPFIAIAIALMVALGGGVAVEHAHTGDSLFGVKSTINSHIGTSTRDWLRSLSIESDTQADLDAEAHGNATSTAAHESNEDRMETQASTTGNVHVGTGTRVKVDTNGGEDDGVQLNGDGHVNTQL